jgi:hypothetical protein
MPSARFLLHRGNNAVNAINEKFLNEINALFNFWLASFADLASGFR